MKPHSLPLWTRALLLAFGLSGLTLLGGGAAAFPSSPDVGLLALWEMNLVGLRMQLPADKLQLPDGATLPVHPRFLLGDRDATTEEVQGAFPADVRLAGTLTSPDSGSVRLEGTPLGGLLLPPLRTQGTYVLSGVRLEQGGKVLLEAPSTISIECLGEVLISSVTAAPMTLQELKAAGLQLGAANYEGRRFTMALTIGSRKVDLSVPVAIPIYNGVEDPRAGGEISRLEIGNIEGGAPDLDLNVALADLKPDRDPFTLSRPAVSHMLNHNFKALIVVPGSIGYLHQFYKVDLVVFNTLSAASPFVVSHLKATYAPPPAADGVGPLRLAARAGDGIDDAAMKPIRAADGDGRPGEGPDRLRGGESGTATYYLEALKTGSHPLDFLIQGQFEGGDLREPIPLSGKAEGRVLVVNPTFNLMLVHPDVVRKGETCVMEARLTNTSGTLANGVTLSIDRTRLGNVKLVETAECPAVQQAPDTLAPGQTVTFRFQFRAQKTGEVTGSYLYAEEGTIGFQLSAGVTERNVRLNPDTLTLPRTLEGLPQALREAMLKVLGQAYCVATSKATLPAGVLPVGRDVVTGRMARSLSEQGLFLGMGTDRLRIWWDLWKLFTLNPDPGFDQLMRTTQAGAELRDAFLEAWTSWLGGGSGPADRLRELAAFGEGTGGTALVGIQGAGPGLVIGLADDSSRFLRCAGQDRDLPAQGAALGTSASGSILVQSPVPAGASLHTVLTNEGTAAMTLKLGIVRPVAGQGDPECSTLTLTLGQGVTATLAPGASGMLEACLTSRAGASLGRVPAEASGPVPAEPFRVLSVHRYDLDLFPDATPYGTHLMVLFNRPTMPLELPSDEAGFQAAEALVQVEANHAWRKATGYQTDSAGGTVLDGDGNPKKLPSPPALVQAFPRVAALYLEKPVGPYVPRRLTLSAAWKDAAGRALEGERTWPIQSGLVPGGALVRGKVRRLDGTGLPAKLTYWYYSALMDASQQDLETSQLFAQEEVWNFYALVTSNVATEADGSFQLDFVPEPVSYALGPFLLQADLPEGRAFAQASVVGNGQTVQMDLVLEGKGAVEGYVLDAQGGPVSGARVQAVQEQATCGLNRGTGGGALAVTATTDTGGHYRLDGLKTGVFSLRALKGLFGVAASGELARDGQVVRQDLVLKGRTGRVRAQVQDEQGHPMPDQVIRLGFPAGLNRSGSGSVGYVYPEEARPGPDGWARFQDVPAGDIRLVAPYLPPSLVTDFAGYLDPDAEVAAVLRLSPKGELATARIQVADASGRPVPGAYLSWSGSLQGSFFARTGEDGRTDPFRLRPGLPVTAYAYHPGWVGMVQGDSLTPQAGGSYLLHVVMPARAVIQGTVRRPDGSPVPGAYVAIPPVWDDNNRNRLAITDARGAYRLADVPVGTAFRLAAVGPELRTCHNDQVQVSPDQLLTLDIPLPYPGNNTLQGTVYQPQEGSQRISAIAQVWVTGQLPDIAPGRDGGNGHWGLLSGTETGAVQSLPVTEEDVQNGRPGFRITGLPSGPFRLAASSGLFPIEVNAGGDFGTAVDATLTQDLTLVSSFAGELKGRVVLPDGQTPVARGARVSLTGGSIGDLTVFVQDDGLYKFAKVIPEGRYVLRAEDPATGFFCSLPLAMQREASQVRNLRLWGKGTLRIQALDSQGQPLSLGDVSLAHSRQSAPLEPGDLPRLVQSLRGATDGRLVFEDLLEGQVSVKLRNQTGLTGMASAEIPVGGGDAEVTVRLQPVGGIRGLLLRADGTPVPAGRVDAYGLRDGQPDAWLGVAPTFQEGVQGRFLFYPLPAGTVRLEAWDPDSRQTGAAAVQVQPCTEADPWTPVTISCLDKGPVTLQVVDETLQPVLHAGLSVAYRGGPALGFTTEATTGQDGRASFTLPPGAYAATATDPVTLATGTLDFTRDPNQEAIARTLVLKGVRSLFATVLPPPGAPDLSLAGWRLRVESLERCTSLDASGQGTLEDLPVGTWGLVLTDLEGRFRGRITARLVQDGNPVQPAGMTALALGTVIVRVLDADGSPLMGLDASLSWGCWSGTAPRTGQDGLARFDHVRQGSWTALAAGASAPFTLESEGQTVAVDLTTAPTAGLHGRVTDPSGNPVPYISVTAMAGGSGVEQGATDAEGRFALAGLPVGRTLSLRAMTAQGRTGWSAPFTLERNHQDLEVDVTLQATGSLRGTLADPLRPQLPPMRIRVTGSGVAAEATTDASGAFQVGSLPAGLPLRFQAIWDDGRTVALDESFTVPGEGQVVPLDRQLPPFVGVKGWTLDGAGRRIPMTVLLRDGRGNELGRAVTTGDIFDPDHPTFFFRYLKAGEPYRLDGCREMTSTVIATLAFTPAGDRAVQEVELRQPSPRTAHLVLRYPDGSVAPGPGHYVLTATGILNGQWQGDLGSDGTAAVPDLPDGPFRVQVTGVPGQPVLEAAFELTGPSLEVFLPAIGVGTVSLTVRTASGRVLQGNALSLAGNGTPVWSAARQGDGSWLATGVWIDRPLAVQAAGFGLLGSAPALSLARHGQALAATYPAPDQGALAGTVRDPGGAPVPGARVELLGRNLAVLTDASGAFRFEPLAVGSYRISATLPGQPDRALVDTALSADGEVRIQDLALRGTGTVRVTVLRPDGSPYPGQTVSAENASPWTDGRRIQAVTDGGGLAAFPGVLEGDVRISATLDGELRTTSGILTGGGTLELALRSRDVSRVSGRVRRAVEANPWPDGACATLQGVRYGLQHDGTLVSPSPEPWLAWTPGVVPVQVSLAGGASFQAGTVTLAKNDLTVVDLRAPAFGTVQGVVRDAANAPVANALVSARGISTASDAQGAYRLEGLPAGSSTLTATLEGRPERAADSANLSGDGGTFTLNLTLKGTGTVTVSVQASDGTPLVGQTVSLRNGSAWSNGETRTAASDAQGIATFTGVLEGAITTSTRLEGLDCSAGGTLAAGQTLSLALQPRPWSTVSGRIRRADPTLAWPEGTRLQIASKCFPLASDGTLQVPDPAPRLDYGNGSAYPYALLPGGRQLSLGIVTLTRNGDTALDLQAPGFGALHGTVKDGNGNPVGGVTIRIDGSSATTTTDANGAWSRTELPVGSHHVTASTPTSIAAGDITLPADGATAALDLTLLANTVSLETYFSRFRTGAWARVRTDSAFEFGYDYSGTRPYLKVDGGSESVPTAPNNVAQWLDKDHQLTYTTAIGPIEVTLTRTMAPQTCLARDEIRMRNTDTASHSVSLRHAVNLGTYQGLPSNQVQPVLGGDGRDMGVLSYYGTVLWGNGADAPLSVSSQGIQWPEWALAPGEQKTLALALAPYFHSSRNHGNRPGGASRVLDRVLHGAPEWTYGGDPAAWSNWMPAQTPLAEALPPWDATATWTPKDVLGRVPVNAGSTSFRFEPRELLAPVQSVSGRSALRGQPADGGTLRITIPGSYSSPSVIRSLETTQDEDLLLPEAAALTVTVQDAHGNLVSDAYTWFSSLGGWYSNAQGIVGPLLVAPGSYNLTATLPGTNDTVQVSGSLQAQGGADNPLTLVFPATGSVHANVFGPDGKSYSNYVSAKISCGTARQWASFSSGVLTWQKVLPGTWTLVVHDPRTGGDLAPITLDVQADAETSVNVALPNLGQVQVTVLDPDGNPASRDQYVSLCGVDGANQWQYTDDGGHVAFTNVAPGQAQLSATNRANNFTSAALVTVPDGGMAQATLRLAGSGDLRISLLLADGSPVQGRRFDLDQGTVRRGSGSTDANGALILSHVPTNTALTLKDSSGNASDPWAGKIPDKAVTLTRNDATTDLSLSLAQGSLQVTLTRAGTSDPLSGATAAIGGWRQSATTNASGTVTFRGVPLDTCIQVDARLSGYLPGNLSCATLSSGQPAGQVQIELDPTLQATVRMRRTNGQEAPKTTAYSYRQGWDYRLVDSAGTASGRTSTDPSCVWPDLQPGNFEAEGGTNIGTLTDGDVNNLVSWGYIWRWKAKQSFTLDAANTPLSVDLTLPALASLTLHLKNAEGQAERSDADLNLTVKNSTVDGYTAWARFNPSSANGDLVMGEHFPEGTHTFVLQYRDGIELGTFDLTVRPEDDAKRLEQSLAVKVPAMASLSLSLQDASGRELQAPHSLRMILKASTVKGYSFNLGLWSNSLNLGREFPEGTHTFAIVDADFGEMTTFDLAVSSADNGCTLARTLRLPYVRSTWNLRSLASDGLTPVVISSQGPRDRRPWLGVYCGDNKFVRAFSPGGNRVVEVPSGTVLRGFAEYCPYGSSGSVRNETGDQTASEGLVVAQDIILPLSVMRFRLLETDGQSEVEHPECDLPGITDKEYYRRPFEIWTDDQKVTRLLVLGQDPGAALKLGIFDVFSGLGRRLDVTVPALGDSLEREITLPPHDWLTTPAFQRRDGGTVEDFYIGISADAQDLVRPDLASWRCRKDSGRSASWNIYSMDVTLSEGSVRFRYGYNYNYYLYYYYWATSIQATRVRVPLGGVLWMASVQNADAWGFKTYTLDPDATLDGTVSETTLTWQRVPFQVQDGNGQPLADLRGRFEVSPAQAPSGWILQDSLSRNGGEGAYWWTYNAPLGLPLRFLLKPSGSGTSWAGTWTRTFDGTEEAPGPDFQATEQTPAPNAGVDR